eukprot:TRINITY_DN6614_c0_g1_i5.p1 TRINITY_DN6614_c0_g1~~TRINITY_DN6614_c0_g1_i5.p1  ORF type:complete len:106 (+),score=11.85 TRINITY_DN6614_c0_g1_i5:383-700(+)
MGGMASSEMGKSMKGKAPNLPSFPFKKSTRSKTHIPSNSHCTSQLLQRSRPVLPNQSKTWNVTIHENTERKLMHQVKPKEITWSCSVFKLLQRSCTPSDMRTQKF